MSVSEISIEKDKIIIAARKGVLEDVVKLSTKFSEDVTTLSETLVMACRMGHLNVVTWLIENTEADVNYKGNYVETEVNHKGKYTMTPLLAACYYGHFSIVKYFLHISRPPNVNIFDTLGDTPLIKSCFNSEIVISKYLIQTSIDIDVNIYNNEDNTALHYTVWRNKKDDSPLHKACKTNNVNEVLRQIYVCKHNINLQNNDGYTPLHLACIYGHRDIVVTLMMAGADEEITSCDFKTAAQVAEMMKHDELLKLVDRISLMKELQQNCSISSLSSGFLVLLTLNLITKSRRLGSKLSFLQRFFKKQNLRNLRFCYIF